MTGPELTGSHPLPPPTSIDVEQTEGLNKTEDITVYVEDMTNKPEIEKDEQPIFEVRKISLEDTYSTPIADGVASLTLTAKEGEEGIDKIDIKEHSAAPSSAEIESLTMTSRAAAPASPSSSSSSGPASTSPPSAPAASGPPGSAPLPVSAKINKVPAGPAANINQLKLDKRNVIAFIRDEAPNAIENKQVKSVVMKPTDGALVFESFKRDPNKPEEHLRVMVTWTITIEDPPGHTKELELNQYLETWIPLPTKPVDDIDAFMAAQHDAKTKAWMLISSYANQYKEALGAEGIHGHIVNPNLNINRVNVLAKTHILTFDLYHPNIEATRNLKVMHQFQNLSPKSEMYSEYSLSRKLTAGEIAARGLPDWVKTEMDLISFVAAGAFIKDNTGKILNKAEVEAYIKGRGLEAKDVHDEIANNGADPQEIYKNFATRATLRLKHLDTLTSSFTDPFPKKEAVEPGWLRANVIDKVTKHFKKEKMTLYGDIVNKVENLEANIKKYDKATKPGIIRKTPEIEIRKNKELINAAANEIKEMKETGDELLARIDVEKVQLEKDVEQYRALQYEIIKKYAAKNTTAQQTVNNIDAKLINSADFSKESKAISDCIEQLLKDDALAKFLEDADKNILVAGEAVMGKVATKQVMITELKTKWKEVVTSAVNAANAANPPPAPAVPPGAGAPGPAAPAAAAPGAPAAPAPAAVPPVPPGGAPGPAAPVVAVPPPPAGGAPGPAGGPAGGGVI